ncbi:Uu.00g081210.m01.CDS01 [Anthostomella pinea]|uniref:Uu.00g081210.m01.CDS01 n=1 Tax=Anthostomella pinea TaxID=933095 RepID=A0AAI8VL49_9PEZI|nr:Uu.00g081210.m01.CDS01 [Anthostomella pinea]
MRLITTKTGFISLAALASATAQDAAAAAAAPAAAPAEKRYQIPDWAKMALSKSCKDISLTDKYTLHATCTYPSSHTLDNALDLNGCFANYGGNLAFIAPGSGGFGASCPHCELKGTKLVCDCLGGYGAAQPSRTRRNELEMDDWEKFPVNGDGSLTCGETEGIE